MGGPSFSVSSKRVGCFCRCLCYLAWATRLSRPGTIIVVDNVIRDGAIIHPEAIVKSIP